MFNSSLSLPLKSFLKANCLFRKHGILTSILIIFYEFILFHNTWDHFYFSFVIKISLTWLHFPKMRSVTLYGASTHTIILNVGTVLMHKGGRLTKKGVTSWYWFWSSNESEIQEVPAQTYLALFFLTFSH